MPENLDQSTMRERLIQALEMMELGYALMRQKLIRDNPGATPEEIEKKFNDWIHEPPPGIWYVPFSYSK